VALRAPRADTDLREGNGDIRQQTLWPGQTGDKLWPKPSCMLGHALLSLVPTPRAWTKWQIFRPVALKTASWQGSAGIEQ